MSPVPSTEGLGDWFAVWLAHGVWQASIVVLVAALALWVLRHRSARVRYAVGALALAAVVLAPSATLLLPSRSGVPGPTAVASETGGLAMAGGDAVAGSLAGTLAQVSPSPEVTALPTRLPAVLLTLWLLGACVGLLRLAWEWRSANARLVRLAAPASEELREATRKVAERVGLRRPVRVLESPFAPSPLVLGVARPTLVLPVGVDASLSPTQLDAVLAHELTHVRRHDPSANLAQCLVEVLFFFHPAVRWLSGRVRLEREHCCDDAAVRLCGSARLYSGALLGLEELRQREPSLALGAGSPPLLARVQRLLGQAPTAKAARGSLLAARVGVGLAVLAGSGVAWAWDGPVAAGRGALSPASCTRAVYPKDFTALATHQMEGRAIRSRIFVSRCGRVRMEPVDTANVQSFIYDASSLELVALDLTSRTYSTMRRTTQMGLPLHLPDGCTEQRKGCTLQGEEVVAGRRVQRWVRVHSPHDTVTQWMDVELGYPLREESDLFGSLTLTDLRVADQDPARFVVPADFRSDTPG